MRPMKRCDLCNELLLGAEANGPRCDRCWELERRCGSYEFGLWASTAKGQSRLRELITDATEALRARGVEVAS